MTYTDLEMANRVGLAAFDGKLMGINAPQYKSAIRDVDYVTGTCFFKDSMPIETVLLGIFENRICVTNLEVLKDCPMLKSNFNYYSYDVLGKPANRVLCATPLFYSTAGKAAICKDLRATTKGKHFYYSASDANIFHNFVFQHYHKLCTLMEQAGKKTSPLNKDILVLMCRRSENGVKYCYKVINPMLWGNIFDTMGFDEYAYYLDTYNLRFMCLNFDYCDESSEGILREVKSGVQLTDTVLKNILAKYKAGEESSILSQYTTSLKPCFNEVFGW